LLADLLYFSSITSPMISGYGMDYFLSILYLIEVILLVISFVIIWSLLSMMKIYEVICSLLLQTTAIFCVTRLMF